MSTYTPNYNFPMYEGTDAPNLLDDYNSFAQLADAQIKAVADANTNTQTAVSNLKSTVDGFDSRLTAAQGTADSALSSAGTASGNASSALAQVQELSKSVSENSESITRLSSDIAGKAPTVHTSPSGATYGQATSSLFGHTRLTDTPGTNDSSGGYAATPALVSSALSSAIVDPITIFSGNIQTSGWANNPNFGSHQPTARVFQIPQARIIVLSLNLQASRFNEGTSYISAIQGLTIPESLRPTQRITIQGQVGMSTNNIWSVLMDVNPDGTVGIAVSVYGAYVPNFSVQVNGMYCYSVA